MNKLIRQLNHEIIESLAARRPERVFDSVEALRRQIEEDVESGRNAFF